MNTTFAEATSVQPIDSHTYSAHFQSDWCIGTVPHGGYVASCFLSVARLHFETTRKPCDQPHTVALQLNFVRRTSCGPATFVLSESKIGRRTSTIHISLSQEGGGHPCVIGYLTQSNLHTESGISLETAYSLSPSPIPIVSTAALHKGSEPNWSLHHRPFNNFRKAGRHVKTYLPSKGQAGKALIDQWICLEDGQCFTQESLGYVADMFPQIVETAYKQEDLERELRRLNPGSEAESTLSSTGSNNSQWARFWYPTVSLNIEIKKAFPLEGAEWLFSRVRSKAIRNGRMDLEVTILDEGGDIVALSTHVALIVGAERNMFRSDKGSRKGERL